MAHPMGEREAGVLRLDFDRRLKESVGDISVEGSVEGNITCRTLTLRGEPTITGDVHAEAVHVCGRS